MTSKETLYAIIEYLNEHFDQDSEEYSIFAGTEPQIIRYNEHIVISLWACGAIICINDILYFIQEDDGNWFVHEDKYQPALQGCFSIGWIESFTDALNRLKEYVWTNGTPVYYSGTDIICHYTL